MRTARPGAERSKGDEDQDEQPAAYTGQSGVAAFLIVCGCADRLDQAYGQGKPQKDGQQLEEKNNHRAPPVFGCEWRSDLADYDGPFYQYTIFC